MSKNIKIECKAYMTTRRNGKTDGIYEVKIDHYRKYLPLNELKEKSGVKRVNQTKRIEEWLNTKTGLEWALSVKEASIY